MERQTLTFALAYSAYLILCIDVLLHAYQRPKRALTITLAVVLFAHVWLVWNDRFRWDISVGLAKGLGGFLLFHATFFAITLSPFVTKALRASLLYAALPAATLGAIGAAFKYDFVSVYRAPILITALVTSLGLLRAFLQRRAKALQGANKL